VKEDDDCGVKEKITKRGYKNDWSVASKIFWSKCQKNERDYIDE
jgi:hypothetical protein